MANIKSQVKRNKTNEKARLHNASIKSALRTASKKVRVACDAKDAEAAKAALVVAVSLIDKSVSKGVQHKNAAARQKSHLQTMVNTL